MKADKQDRRSQRTRRIIGEALVSLMHERRYADLTVQDILDRANIGRSTFYAHYWDKDDLLASEIKRMLGVLFQRMQTQQLTGIMLFPSLGLLQHVQEESHLYWALMRGQGLDLTLRTMRDHLCTSVEARLANLTTLPPTGRAVLAQGIVGSFLALLTWWMESESPLSAKELDSYYQQLIVPSLQSIVAQ